MRPLERASSGSSLGAPRRAAPPRRALAAARIHVGTSGFRYRAWRGRFYPPGLPRAQELTFLARQLRTLEINASFYRLQSPALYEHWSRATPEDFVFALKGSRYVTHMKRLQHVEAALANFFASGLLCLEQKLGPLLWQLPERLRFDRAVLEGFLKRLPRDTVEASRLAARHDERVLQPGCLQVSQVRPMRHAMEVRSETFVDGAFVELLRKHEVALVVADTAGRFPYLEDLTADFVYVRLHGAEALYASGYTPEALDAWARRLRQWSAGQQAPDAILIDPSSAPQQRPREVFVYFDNDAKVHAPYDAIALEQRLERLSSEQQAPSLETRRAR